MSEEEKKLLLEMRDNCIDKGKTYYEDDKRVKKARAIEKAIETIEKQQKEIESLKELLEE
jgi:hypothetical protein